MENNNKLSLHNVEAKEYWFAMVQVALGVWKHSKDYEDLSQLAEAIKSYREHHKDRIKIYCKTVYE